MQNAEAEAIRDDTDYQEQLEALLVSTNAFAIITAAHILTQRTRKSPQVRYDAKFRLLRLLYQNHWDKQQVIDLFWVLDWLMRLPEELERQLRYEIDAIEERENMRYVTSFERFAKEEGRQEGLLEGEAKLLKKQLQRRFGDLPAWVTDQLLAANQQDLERWGEAVLTMPTLSSVFNDSPTH